MEYRLSKDWEGVDTIIAYGFGKEARDNLDFFIKRFRISMIVDGNPEKCGGSYRNIPVMHLDLVKHELKNYKIIIMTVARNAVSIEKDLESLGLEAYKDFCSLEQFVTEWFWRFKNQVYLMEVHTAITTQCTLRCRNCNMFMSYYKEQFYYSVEDIAADLEALFAQVNYVLSYRILGGEPLLNKELPQMLSYIGECYGDRIGNIGVITNGTVLIGSELAETAKKYKVKFEISDYTNQVSYEKIINENINCLKMADIWYERRQSMRWCDFGFPEKNRSYATEKIRDHMLSCGPVFHGLNDGKFYYCHVAWSAEKCKLFKNSSDDCVDLKGARTKDIRLEILEHSQGNIKKGYVNLCKVCGGCGNDNNIFVNAGEQVGKPVD